MGQNPCGFPAAAVCNWKSGTAESSKTSAPLDSIAIPGRKFGTVRRLLVLSLLIFLHLHICACIDSVFDCSITALLSHVSS
ncbi:hypothetical protein CIB84_012317 [Bambusicola thoracicus]|uniref:Uncharacterized protein n=1 Tax=Bambusicola thoracicus TaxID=9083 RepID=A0A2P4SIK6_BAMTH|nr:hypothetical protein CIB84_012317 [Bambusicola thoracicus]